jgi:CelD/BcsL family acetyltransferase involved in cellulose biosynthesis
VSLFDFLYPWYCHYSGSYGGTPLVGVAWAGTDLCGIAPFTVRRGRLGRVPVTRVDFAPTDSIAGEFLIDEHRHDLPRLFLHSLVAHTRFDVACLNGFEQGTRLLPALQQAAAGLMDVESEGHAYAVVDLDAGYERYWQRLAGDTRRKLNHRARKIDARGAAVASPLPLFDAAEACRRAERLIAITEASYKLQGQRLADHHRGFLMDIVRRFALRGMLSLPILTIGGSDAAFILGVVERGRFYDITLSYDERFAALGPGMYLMQATLKEFAAAGVHTVVSHGAHEYKRTWSTRFVPQTRVYLFRPTLRGRLARLTRFGLQPVWRHLGVNPALGDASPL